MSNDPLALADITAGLPQDAEYDAVHAAVTATERGRWFLTEYANRNRNADTDLVVSAIARMEAAIRGDRTGEELPPGPDVGAASERIADIAIELRERGADPKLCDLLDAAVREICNACAAPAAVRDVEGSAAIDFELPDSTKFAEATAALAAPLSALAGDSQAVNERPSRSLDIAVPLQNYAEIFTPPADELAQRPRWYIEPPDFVIAPADRGTNNGGVESSDRYGQAHPLLPGAQLLPDPEDDPADLFEPVPQRVGLAPHSAPMSPAATPAPVPASPPREPAPPQLRIAAGSAIRSALRPPPSDPLAALDALSDEERIALFG
jgi:hypothetical protein